MVATDIDKLVIYRRGDDRDLVTLATPTTQLGANSTGSVLAVPIGFAFTLDGTAYTTLDIAAAGLVRFAGTVPFAASLYASDDNVLLGPWYDTLETADTVGYVKTELQGAAPWRRFVIEWYCNLQSGQTGTDYDRAKFQLVLYETSNRWDYRYGDIETAGAPSRASYSASVGFKGNTVSVTDNYRDCAVENRTLGGSNTTTTANLAAPSAWPRYTVVAEPAWPMCGRAYLLDIEQIAALQDRYAEPVWAIANFVNWLICNHRPPLIDFSPWQETALPEVVYVVPVTPSVDGLTYDVYVQTYSGGGGDLRMEIDRDNGTMPVPTDDATWTNLVTTNVLGTASGWREWTAFQVTPGVTTRCLRITASNQSASTIILGSVLIVPQALADINETATPPSGALPMSIAQLRQEGGAIHPEFYNRAWATIRAVIFDRKQMAWSSVWSEGYGLQSTNPRPRRRVAIAPASFDGWPAQTVMMQAFCKNGMANTKMTVGELGSGVAVTVDVDSSYTLIERELALTSDQPVVSVESEGWVYPMAVCLRWAPDLGAGDLIIGVTPPPRLEYLSRLAARMERALGAYVMTGIATALCRGKSTTNAARVQYQVPPATKALRVRLVRTTVDTANAGDDTTIYGVTSGATANDQVVIEAPQATGRDDYPPEGGHVVVNGALVYQPSPSAAMDRLLESPTMGTMAGPVRERLDVVRGAGITLIPQRDLTV